MDSRAKQRLTGAVILVALFVLLVPELLTGPNDGEGADLSETPNEDGLRRYTIDLNAPAGGVQPMAPVEPAGQVALPPVAAPANSASRALPGEPAQPATATATPAPVISTPMATPPPTVATQPTPVPARPPASAPPAAVAVPTPAPRFEPAPAATSRGGFAVQLGSFVSKENAERLVRDMTVKGFNAFVAPPIKSGGRDLYRVRVGPTRDRASAEALAAQLRRIGQAGSVVSIS